MNKKILFSFILALLLTRLSSKAEQTIYLSSSTKDFVLSSRYYDWFEDTTTQLTIQEITQPGFSSQFNNSPDEYNYVKNTNAAYWIKFTINDTSVQSEKWILELLSLHTQDLQLYVPLTDSTYQLIQTGQRFHFNQRSYAVTNFVFDLPTTYRTEKTFYVRIQSKHTVGFEFKIRSQQYFTQYTVSEYFFLGLYYGILLIMAVYNLFLFITSKENVYLYYVLYVFSCMLNSFAEDGLGFQFLWPAHPEWNWFINNYLWSFFFLFSFIAYASEFLELKKQQPKLRIALLASVFIYIVSFFINFNFDLFDLFLLPFLFTYGIGIYVLLKGYKQARFFVLGFSFVFISILIYQLRTANLIEHNLFTVYSFNYGIILEVVVLSIALGDRIRIMKAEKEQSQLLLIEKLEENQELQQKVNRELESKVTMRTQELLQKSNELTEANQKLQKLTEDLNAFASKLDYDNWELHKKVVEETKARMVAKELSFEEFMNIFPEEQACLQYLENLKWKNGYSCKKCGNTKYAFKQKFLSRKCSKCNYIESVLSSTIFHGVKFELTKAFYITYLTTNKHDSITIDELSALLDLNRATCWKFRKKVLDKEAEILQKFNLPKIDNWETLILD